MNEKKIIKALEMIAQDQADDAKNFEGKPFTGRTVAEYFGNQGAAIAALANIIKSLVEAAEHRLQSDSATGCPFCGVSAEDIRIFNQAAAESPSA